MTDLAKLNAELITSEFFLRYLRFHGDYTDLMDRLLSDRATVQAGRRAGIDASDDEVQERIDQIRRVHGLHRAKDAIDYIESLGFDVETYAEFVRDELIREKVMAEINSEAAVAEYFKLHSPRFEVVELSNIVVESDGMARELVSILEDDPDSFPELAAEHSLSIDSADSGGSLGPVMRGMLAPHIESKVFNAASGDILGPFESEDGLVFEIFRVDGRREARLDATTADAIGTTLHRDWLKNQVESQHIEFLG